MPPIFGAIGQAASLDDDELYRTFNMGIGFALVIDARLAPDAAAFLRERGERVYEIGEIVQGSGSVVYGG